MSALSLVLRSDDAVQNTRALFVLLGTCAAAGVRVAFYGGNAAGILVMDDARGRRIREIPDALRAALATAHRLRLALLIVFSVCALAAGALPGQLWLSRMAVSGPVTGPLLFGLAVPNRVLAVGLTVRSLMVVVVPLAAPAVWSGATVLTVVSQLFGLVFALALLLPGLVYLRGTCAVYLALTEEPSPRA